MGRSSSIQQCAAQLTVAIFLDGVAHVAGGLGALGLDVRHQAAAPVAGSLGAGNLAGQIACRQTGASSRAG
jgi:hypothetical protein